MNCTRCGIDVTRAGMCRDCCDVEDFVYREGMKPQRYVVIGGRRFVTSSFKNGQSMTPEEHSEIRRRTLAGESARVIALAVGCSSRAVTRERAAMKREKETK